MVANLSTRIARLESAAGKVQTDPRLIPYALPEPTFQETLEWLEYCEPRNILYMAQWSEAYAQRAQWAREALNWLERCYAAGEIDADTYARVTALPYNMATNQGGIAPDRRRELLASMHRWQPRSDYCDIDGVRHYTICRDGVVIPLRYVDGQWYQVIETSREDKTQ